MDNTRQVTTPEEMHNELREERKEIEALSEAEMQEATAEIAQEATVRAGMQTEEAERWTGVNTSDEGIHEIMTRAVAEIVPRDEFEKMLRSGRKLRVKLGIDPTGPRLHIGRTVPLFKLRQFQDMGHQIVLIIGDFTAIVGDPSDKDAQRVMLTPEQIEANMATYKEQIGKILDIDKVEFRYNAQWLGPLTFHDVVRLASKFTVAQMIQRENFSVRWEEGKPIGLHELLYPLMQGFDSVAIEADIELGGTDQLFNLMAGRALQPEFGQPPQGVICTNMIAGTDGRKMSTTWGNAIYLLDEARDQFGKTMKMGDEVIPVYMESCTLLPMDEVKRVREGLEDGSVHPMDAKKQLAWEIVRMYHGKEAANTARADFERQFQNRETPSEIPLVPIEKVVEGQASLKGGSVVKATGTVERPEVSITDLLIRTGLAPSRKHATRLVEQGGVRINDERITSRDQMVKPEDGMIIKVGRSYVKLEG